MNFATGTKLPLVIVESCSMYHQGNPISNFDNWWENHEDKYSEINIQKNSFLDFKLKNGFNKGDILLIVGSKPEKIKVGDIIIFDVEYKNPIIHRVISITKDGEKYIFSTMGDNNNGQIPFEKAIPEDKILGKAKANIAPLFGWIKLILFEHRQPTNNKGFCAEN